MTATFGADLVAKTARAKVDACRARVQSAARAAQQLETDVRWLVKERAWEVLGYKDFSEMWEKENGFTPPTHVQVLAVAALRDEGMNTLRRGVRNGHTQVDVARMVGLSVSTDPRDGRAMSVTAQGVLKQLELGVPPERVIKGAGARAARVIDTYGSRKRAQPRRLGKAPNELVAEALNLPRSDADAIAEIARQADVPKAEIYRQAVAEYLMRHRESRPGVAS